MIIESLGQQAKTNIKTERASFSVSADKAKKFLHIAVRNLYTNPVLAATVEIAQNAHDEHVRRGIASKPFIVTMPTNWKPTFSVRDFGAGIPHDYMLNGYTLALESTKDSEEDMSGGWGLGRLALLSLASTYNVTTFIKGIQRDYSIFESEKGIEILLTGEKETKEQDGTLVSAPVPPNHVGAFRDAFQRAFRYYNVKPTIHGESGFKIGEPTYIIKGDGWAIENNSGHASAVCGIYHYKIDSSNISNLSQNHRDILDNVGAVLFFGPSDLSPMANRQGLYYNEKTVNAIKKKLNDIENGVIAEVQGKFDKCKTYFEAKCLYNKIYRDNSMSRLNSIVRGSGKLKWNGIVINDGRFENLKKVTGLTVSYFPVQWSRGGYTAKHIEGVEYFEANEKSEYYLNDLTGARGLVRRGKYRANEIYSKDNSLTSNVYVLTFATDADKVKFLKDYNLLPDFLTPLSTVVPPKSVMNKDSAVRARTKIFVWNGEDESRMSYFSKCWDVAEVDLEEDEGIYIPIEKFCPEGFSSMADFARKIAFLREGKALDADAPIYGVRSNSEELTEIKKDSAWTPLDSIIKNFVKTYVIPDEEIQLLVDYEEWTNNWRSAFGYSLYWYSQSYPTKAKIANMKHKGMADYFEKMAFMYAQSQDKTINTIKEKHRTFTNLGGVFKSSKVKPTYSIAAETRALNASIPILKFVGDNLGSEFSKYVELGDILVSMENHKKTEKSS